MHEKVLYLRLHLYAFTRFHVFPLPHIRQSAQSDFPITALFLSDFLARSVGLSNQQAAYVRSRPEVAESFYGHSVYKSAMTTQSGVCKERECAHERRAKHRRAH